MSLYIRLVKCQPLGISLGHFGAWVNSAFSNDKMTMVDVLSHSRKTMQVTLNCIIGLSQANGLIGSGTRCERLW